MKYPIIVEHTGTAYAARTPGSPKRAYDPETPEGAALRLAIRLFNVPGVLPEENGAWWLLSKHNVAVEHTNSLPDEEHFTAEGPDQ